MRKELIYIWIERDGNRCFHKQGFNFSPCYDFQFDNQTRELHFTETETPNIFCSDNIMSLSALIGENGTGKTTLMNYLASFDDIPLSVHDSNDKRYEAFERESKLDATFIAVYFENNSTLKILNVSAQEIYFDGSIIEPINRLERQTRSYFEDVSRIVITNSEYVPDSNLYHSGIHSLTLNSSLLNARAKQFYNKIILNSNMGSRFNLLQKIITEDNSNREFQAILDVLFYCNLRKNGRNFIGKEVKAVDVFFKYCTAILRSKLCGEFEGNPRKKEAVQKIENASAIYGRYSRQIDHNENRVYSGLILNLAYELTFCYKFSPRTSFVKIDDLYAKCREFIRYFKFESKEEECYYKNAIVELDEILPAIARTVLHENELPKQDLGYHQYVSLDVLTLGKILKSSIDSERGSFIAKYISAVNLEMSSGERALLNMMSRLSMLKDYKKVNQFDTIGLKENVLLLFDEIDLYVHPNWQSKLVFQLLQEVKSLFVNKNIQIIISSHSPIVLSDIPRENITFLRIEDGKAVVESGRTHKQTFAAHIYSLYNDALFIRDSGGMGEFAYRFINDLYKRLINDRGDFEDDIKKKIDLIGEPIIRKKLLSLCKNDPYQRFTERITKREFIARLREQKSIIERQLAALEEEDDD